MSEELKGFVACVTGGARGLGASIVRQLAHEGATVILADVLNDEGERLAAELQEEGFSVIFKTLDVTDEDQWKQLVDDINEAFGRLDIVVNNAAIIVRKRLSELSVNDWNRALSVNLTGVFLSVKHCRPLLARSPSASIVNVSSTAGMIAHLDPSYTASKWAVRGFTKSAALELIGDGIRVNSVHPSMIATPLTEAGPPGHIEANRHAIPLGREATPQEITNVIYFLCSPKSSYMTGSEVVADGGMTTAGVAHMRAKFQAQYIEKSHETP